MNWGFLIAAGTVVFSFYSYELTRRRELAWKRTEFLCTQAQYLDTDSDLTEAVKILEGRHADITGSQLFDDNSDFDKAKQNEYRQKMDKLLNFLWRLCYAYLETKTISQKEVEGFGWYFWRIDQIPYSDNYCEGNGYKEITKVINELEYIKKMRELHAPPPTKDMRPTAR